MLAMSEHVVVIGNIGSGKTTAVRALGEALGADVYEERFGENPYLERFYADPLPWAALNQLWFLGEVGSQHAEIAARGGPAVQEQSIYTVFEVMTGYLADTGSIGDDDLALVRRHHDVLAGSLPPPACVVRLQAPTGALLDRIAERGRDFERAIGARELDAIEARIAGFAADWRRSPLIEVDTAETDPRDPDHAVRLAHTIRATLDADPA
jgi:deoxyadenosine/deoxycytidine kinase